MELITSSFLFSLIIFIFWYSVDIIEKYHRRQPEENPWRTGPRGGSYRYVNGRRVYRNSKPRKKVQEVRSKYVSKFINEQLLQLNTMNGENKSCPICWDNDISHFSSCGHGHCKTCLKKINKCSICRMSFKGISK